MTAERIGALLMLIPGGIWAGVLVAIQVERVVLWDRMPIDQYAVDFRRALYRFDPMQPILTVILVCGSLLFAFNTSGTAETFAFIAAGLGILVIVTSVTIGEPLNSKFRRREEGDVPPGAAEIRTTWRRFNLFRTITAVSCLACMAVAVTYA